MSNLDERLKTGVGGPGWRVPEPFNGPPIRRDWPTDSLGAIADKPRARWRREPTRLDLIVRIAVQLLWLVSASTALAYGRHDFVGWLYVGMGVLTILTLPLTIRQWRRRRG